jgi:uncharacterized protein (DUF1015 family)
VPRFEPFAAVRYSPDRVELADVVAPPYDVIGPDDLARLEGRSPYNVVRVDLPRSGLAQPRYETARCLFDQWLAEGVLTPDDAPSFYLYRMGWRDDDGRLRQTSGVLGALELDAARAGDVLPHERTMAKPMDDRLQQLRACRANVSPIWGLSLATGLAAASEPLGPPLVRFTDEDGVHHRLWRITAPARIEAVASIVASAPVVIADGHHRYETALAYRSERRAANGDQSGPYDLVLAYLVELAEEELGVRPIHRLLSALPDEFSVLDALSQAAFSAEPAGAPRDDLADRMAAAGAIGLVLPGDSYLLRPRPGLPAGADAATEPGSEVDSEHLENALDALPPHEVAYHHDVEHVLALLDKGEAQAAVLLRPMTVAQIAAAARAGHRLPQKTTFFHPKLRTGLVFRFLDR